MAASLDVWVEGDWGDESVNWHIDKIPFDMNRFHADDVYADYVNKHIERALEHLADELSEIALYLPEVHEDWRTCE